MSKPIQFPAQLRALRRSLRLTQAQTAALLGMPPRVYWSLEHGQVRHYTCTEAAALAILGDEIARRETLQTTEPTEPNQ